MPPLVRPEPAAADPLTVAEDVRFRAGPWLLHGEMAYPEDGAVRGAVVLAGPHPLLGGNMRNNVIRALAAGLARRGFGTFRFDYRGVGKSEGPPIDVPHHVAEFWRTSHVAGEADLWQDVQAAADWLVQAVPGVPLALAGYSFGCSLLPFVQNPALAALAVIAPTVGKHGYDAYRDLPTPLLIVAPADDFAADAAQLDAWLTTLAMQRQVLRPGCDNHFFRGHEGWLADVVARFLDNREVT